MLNSIKKSSIILITSVNFHLCPHIYKAPPSEASSDEKNIESDSKGEWQLFDDDEDWLQNATLLRHYEAENFTDDMSEPNNNTPINGLHWVFNGTISTKPSRIMNPRNTTVKQGCETMFSTPISSMMTMFPLLFWEVIVAEVNRYAEQKLSRKKEMAKPQKRKLISGYKWQPVTLNEIMMYFGILIYGMLYPQTGRRMRDAWESPYHNAGFFKLHRHCTLITMMMRKEGRQTDSLHKVRPLLNIVKKTLGRYAVCGSEVSYDEATMANKSSYGRFLICFNPMKPTGKFHFKIYMLCCAQTNLTLKMKIHTKDDSDLDANDTFDDMMNKLDNATLQICKPLYNSGITVNMDNYYMSTTCAMKLRKKQYFAEEQYVPAESLYQRAFYFQLQRFVHCLEVHNA